MSKIVRCDTWELLADAIYPGKAAAIKKPVGHCRADQAGVGCENRSSHGFESKRLSELCKITGRTAVIVVRRARLQVFSEIEAGAELKGVRMNTDAHLNLSPDAAIVRLVDMRSGL